MRSLASNHLPRIPSFLFLLLVLGGSAEFWQGRALGITQLDLELNEAIQKKDWPSVTLLIQPKKGQNFERDLILAKALLELERRQEALALLSNLLETRKDERVSKLFQTAGNIFFSQETSNLYYEALEFIKSLKVQEAKEHLELGLSKEPGQVLLLTRLVQVELLLGQKERASAILKQVQAITNGSIELRMFAAKLAVDKSLLESYEEKEAELYREFSPIRSELLKNEVTLTYWAQGLKRAQKKNELEGLAKKTLKDQANWTFALQWFYQNGVLSGGLKEKLRAQIDKNLKDKNAFSAALDSEMKQSAYLWVGYVNYETLVKQMNEIKSSPTPSR